MPEGSVHITTRTLVPGVAVEILEAAPAGASIPVEHVVKLLRDAEERAFRAEKNAEIICRKAIEAVRAAQFQAEQTEARTRQLAQHAVRHIKLLFEGVVRVEALSQEWASRIPKVEPV